MQRAQRSIIGLVALALAGTAAWSGGAAIAGEKEAKEELLERGRHLVTVGGCHDCHSPKVMSPNGPVPHPMKILSGHPAEAGTPAVPQGVLAPDRWVAMTTGDMTAWVGPWGISYAANLTPDPATGLGGWTEELFIKTLRTGKHHGTGRQILPPMPWTNYAQMSDGELKAVFAYLRSLPPVKNLVPQPAPPGK
ncbi:Nicotinate dehydrogenase subunit B [Planctomycetaceae bacterium]|nr:Nicotinate dehydrogenase subunit B [Planctomycetaceae bacterium]